MIDPTDHNWPSIPKLDSYGPNRSTVALDMFPVKLNKHHKESEQASHVPKQGSYGFEQASYILILWTPCYGIMGAELGFHGPEYAAYGSKLAF